MEESKVAEWRKAQRVRATRELEGGVKVGDRGVVLEVTGFNADRLTIEFETSRGRRLLERVHDEHIIDMDEVEAAHRDNQR